MLHHCLYDILSPEFVIPDIGGVIVATEMAQVIVGGAMMQVHLISIPNR